MNRTKNTQNTTALLWLSDLHLEQASDETRKRFLERLRSACCDAVLITGDISTSEHLTRHLGEISDACDDRKVYYLLGNHDYFHGSIHEVDRTVIALSQSHRNLIPLGQGVKYDGRACRWERQPFFTNSAAGNTIAGILKRFPHRRITVHAGHSHSAANVRMSRNLSIQVAGAQPGRPAFNELLHIN